MDLPEALKRIRKERGMPQTKVAAAGRISITQYQNYEYGKCVPTAPVLIRIADFYDVSIDYLVGRSDDPARH